MKDLHVQIANELGRNAASVLGRIPGTQLREVVELLMSARNIHVLGIGHSGFLGRILSMKLNHVGLTAFTVYGETTPPIAEGDLFVAISQSGSTSTMISLAEKANAVGAKVLAITSDAESALAKLADTCLPVAKRDAELEFPGMSILGNCQHENMDGALFGASIYALFYTLVIMVMQERGETPESIDARHANLQ